MANVNLIFLLINVNTFFWIFRINYENYPFFYFKIIYYFNNIACILLYLLIILINLKFDFIITLKYKSNFLNFDKYFLKVIFFYYKKILINQKKNANLYLINLGLKRNYYIYVIIF